MYISDTQKEFLKPRENETTQDKALFHEKLKKYHTLSLSERAVSSA